MWRQQSELSDLDADALDALCAIYLNQASEPDDAAVADVDEILAMRGLKPKRGGQGRRGGYEPEQRAEMLRALSHIQNLWIDVGDVPVYERDGRRPVLKKLQSRPFIITDRMGQIRLDGYMDVERFIFRPGKAFAAFLFGSGRQLGLLFQKALQYDPFRRRWEKRLTRYFSWQWRGAVRAGELGLTCRVATLIEAIGEPRNQRYPAKTLIRLQSALDTVQRDEVIASWRYVGWKADDQLRRGWAERWLDAELSIEAPAIIKSYYDQVRDNGGLELLGTQGKVDTSLASRIRRHRKALGLSQVAAAEQLGVQQGYFSKLERGQGRPSVELASKIESWLGG
jgi:DNA-binding XRE family transcriptional regulator